MAQLLIYRASAGSGKTHILVTSYIQWALRNPDAFKHILAVTFTNRATQEMKQRILSYLYSLSIGEETVLRDELCQTGWTTAQLQLRSKEILSMVIYQYSDFLVTTIDSFFHRIIQSFAQSLGISHYFSIEMDESLALQEVIEELFTLDEPMFQKWVVDFSLTKLLAGKSWNVRDDIQSIGRSLFDESFKLHEKKLLTWFQQQETWSHFVLVTHEYLRSFEEKMQKIGQDALNILNKEGLTPSDFAYGTKGVIGYFLQLANKKKLKPTKRAIIGRDDLKSWYSKQKTNQLENITRVTESLLHPLLLQAMTLYEEESLAYRTAIVRARFAYTFGMIGALLIGLERYRSKHHLLFISDISALLYQTIQRSDTPFLYEKVGNQLHHFLIDEFQDLSLFQWMNIKPLLRNSLAQGYNSLVVGDVKQSIYRWRGSNWKLLNHQIESEFQESIIHSLITNRRSKDAIVLFNNYFFKKTSNQLVDYLESILPSIDLLSYELAQMRRTYDDVVQKTNSRKGGYVELLLLHADPMKSCPIDWKLHAQHAYISLLEQLKKEGISANDIVVLVRNNSESKLITKWCNHTAGLYKVVSDHVHALGSHIAIKVLIHALYYLNHEDDMINKIAWVEAYGSYIGNTSGMTSHDRCYTSVDNDIYKLLPQSFWAQKDFLKNLSIYSCVHLLISCLFTVPHEFGDVLAFFQSIVLNFYLTESSDIEEFLVWWEKRGRLIKLPISQYEDVIRVMTIHQSKGLAFKVVIIPFCSWSLDHQNGPILWSSHHQFSPHFPIWPVSYGVDLKETHYAKDYYLEQIQVYLDNLNLLYVAFTRAEEKLYVIVPWLNRIEGMTTIADVICQSLVGQDTNRLCREDLPLVVDVQETSVSTKFCFR